MEPGIRLGGDRVVAYASMIAKKTGDETAVSTSALNWHLVKSDHLSNAKQDVESQTRVTLLHLPNAAFFNPCRPQHPSPLFAQATATKSSGK